MSELIKTLNKYSCQKHGKEGVEDCLACEIWLDIKSAIDCIAELTANNKQPAKSLTRDALEWAHTYLLSENIKQSHDLEELQAKLEDRDMLYEAGISAAREEIAEL